jgi:hypothetical protein
MNFGPEKLGQMIHPNLVVQGFTFMFRHFVSNTSFLNVRPTPSSKSSAEMKKKKNYAKIIQVVG